MLVRERSSEQAFWTPCPRVDIHYLEIGYIYDQFDAVVCLSTQLLWLSSPGTVVDSVQMNLGDAEVRSKHFQTQIGVGGCGGIGHTDDQLGMAVNPSKHSH